MSFYVTLDCKYLIHEAHNCNAQHNIIACSSSEQTKIMNGGGGSFIVAIYQ